MLSDHTKTPLDRALFARRPSWTESVAFYFRELRMRAEGRMSRSRCEARVRALATVCEPGPVPAIENRRATLTPGKPAAGV